MFEVDVGFDPPILSSETMVYQSFGFSVRIRDISTGLGHVFMHALERLILKRMCI